MLSVPNFYQKGTISEVRVHGCAKFGHARCWSMAICKFSIQGSFDHHGKGEKENEKIGRFQKMKTPEHPRRSVRKNGVGRGLALVRQ